MRRLLLLLRDAGLRVVQVCAAAVLARGLAAATRLPLLAVEGLEQRAQEGRALRGLRPRHPRPHEGQEDRARGRQGAKLHTQVGTRPKRQVYRGNETDGEKFDGASVELSVNEGVKWLSECSVWLCFSKEEEARRTSGPSYQLFMYTEDDTFRKYAR